MRARLESYARTIDRGIARRRRRAVIAQPQLAVAGTAAAGATPALTARRQEILDLARDAANEGTGGIMASMEAITREDGDGGGGGGGGGGAGEPAPAQAIRGRAQGVKNYSFAEMIGVSAFVCARRLRGRLIASCIF